eukprot:754831-Alexandrium_andersonii.AAC.1
MFWLLPVTGMRADHIMKRVSEMLRSMMCAHATAILFWSPARMAVATFVMHLLIWQRAPLASPPKAARSASVC